MFAALFTAVFAISIWFYIFTLLLIILAIICEEYDAVEFAIILFLVYAVAIQFIAKINLFKWVIENPLHLLWIIPGYVVIALIWSVIKWWLFVTKIADKKRDVFIEFKRDRKITTDTLTKRQKEEWNQHEPYSYTKPLFSENKRKITVWAMYWPTSLIWSFLNDFVKRFFSTMVNHFRKLYEAITNKAFKDMDNIQVKEIRKG